MRSLISALLLFLIVLGAITLNSIFLHRSADEMLGTASVLPYSEEQEEQLEELESFWDKRRTLLSLSVKYDYIERMNDLLISLRAAISAGNHTEVERICLLICELCDSLSQYERISIHSLL